MLKCTLDLGGDGALSVSILPLPLACSQARTLLAFSLSIKPVSLSGLWKEWLTRFAVVLDSSSPMKYSQQQLQPQEFQSQKLKQINLVVVMSSVDLWKPGQHVCWPVVEV